MVFQNKTKLIFVFYFNVIFFNEVMISKGSFLRVWFTFLLTVLQNKLLQVYFFFNSSFKHSPRSQYIEICFYELFY